MSDTLLLGVTGIDVFPLLPDPVVCTDSSGKIVLFNRAAEQCFGYAASEVVGQPVELLIPLKYRAQHSESVSVFANQSGSAERIMGERRIVWGLRKNGEEFPSEARISREKINGQIVLTVVHRDITERAEEERRRDAVAHELDHRIKNVFSVVAALVALTARHAPTVGEFRASLQDRLSGLAATQSFLIGTDRGAATLGGLLEAELKPYCADETGSLVVEGEVVALRHETVQPLAMAFHELATNSAKYGALSQPDGRVTVAARIDEGRAAPWLTIDWLERGGPSVGAPDRAGFGSLLIDQMIRRALHGEVSFEYNPDGLACRIGLPMVARSTPDEQVLV